MKKIMIIAGILLAISGSLQAQTFSEWFRQKKTQKEYLIQQIAALQVYIGYAKKGYNIAKDGLNTIGGFTRGEFDLHGDFISSLGKVNPEIRHYAKVADIIAMQVKIVQGHHRTLRQLRRSDALSGDELAYIGRVFGRLLDDCEKTLDELITLTTDGRLEMKDDERMARIDKLYLDMQDKYTFSQSFGSDARTLNASRKKEQTDIQTSRALLDIKPEQP
ncbi:hypothetical protein [Sphingobacterium hotanense]|uniref:hypothetical protein n=1 Tax=Sphingobacterium hotanense TaxID=649196 RepID=UPI0021A8BA8A|nr:hypothetical protein [Sphingobacterium hotanense]MCT1523838.1 hypothetical protein [Sphingobacterium hotanense]